MFLHLGEGVVVPSDQVIGIFDLDNTTISKDTRAFLKHVQDMGNVVNIGSELPKSFIVCVKDGKETLFTSQISSATLLKRAEQIGEYDSF